MKNFYSLLILSILFVSCVEKNDTEAIIDDNFNRELVLSNWVNNLAIPAFAAYKIKVDDLALKTDAFVNAPNSSTQQDLQLATFEALKTWQHVAMFELQGTTRTFLNTYPIDRETSTFPVANSNEDDFTLETNLTGTKESINAIDFVNASGSKDEQGYPALDFLLNQSNSLSKFTDSNTAENYKTYLSKVVDRIQSLTNTANTYWNANASSIIANDGRNATASFDLMLNDYISYVEQGFRENKISVPSGKRDGITNTEAVETFFSPENSKELFEEAFIAVQNFYTGTSYDGTSTGFGLDDYLDFLNATVFVSKENTDFKITEHVETVFNGITVATADLNENFVTQIETDNSKMLATFNAIQTYVVLIKVNVFQAVGVNIDFVDSDGD